MTSNRPIIIFGPTGNVGGYAAITASKLGAKVILAMPDPSEKIPALSEQDEKAGNYVRVKADLSDPDSVKSAVQETSAKKAFIYHVNSNDHMRGTLQALKEGGIEFVVFLSSFSVIEPLESYPPSDIIPYKHAQAELQLQTVFQRENFIALRPGSFASNLQLWHGKDIKARAKTLRMPFPSARRDCITPEDIGEVAANILVKEVRADHAVYLFGPEMKSIREQVAVVEKALGHTFEVEVISQEEAAKEYMSRGVPEGFAKYLASQMRDIANSRAGLDDEVWREGVKNVERYTGHPAMGFEEWVGRNLGRFR